MNTNTDEQILQTLLNGPVKHSALPQGTHFTVHWFTLTRKAVLATAPYVQVDYHMH